MFIIFGWPRRKSGVHTLSAYCPRCRRETVHRGFHERAWFTLFFIPVFPLSGRHPHAFCNVCGQDVWDGSFPLGRPEETSRQQIELAWQEQREIQRIEGRPVKRKVGGIVAASIGGFMLLISIAMLVGPAAPGNTLAQQRFSGVFCLVFFGLAPLAVAVALFRAARAARRALDVLSCPGCRHRNHPGSKQCGQCGRALPTALPMMDSSIAASRGITR
jgi:hypothetical protein